MEVNRPSVPVPHNVVPAQISSQNTPSAPGRLGENNIRPASSESAPTLTTPEKFKAWAENHDLNLTGYPQAKIERYSEIIIQDLERKNLAAVLDQTKSSAGDEAAVKNLFEKLNLQAFMGKTPDPGLDLSTPKEIGKLTQALKDILTSKLDEPQRRVFNEKFNPPREIHTATDHLEVLNQMNFALKEVNQLIPSKFSVETAAVTKPLAKHVANRIVQQERDKIKEDVLDKLKYLNNSGANNNLAVEMDLGVSILHTPLKATVNLSHKETAQTSQALGVLREKTDAGKFGFEIKLPIIEAGPSVGATVNLSRTSGRGFDNVSDFVDHFTNSVLDLTLSSPGAAKSAKALKKAVASDSDILTQSDQMKLKLQDYLRAHGEGASNLDELRDWRNGSVELALPEPRSIPASAAYKVNSLSYGGFGKLGFKPADVKVSYEHKHTHIHVKGETSLTKKMLEDEDLLKSRTEKFEHRAQDDFFERLGALKEHISHIESASITSEETHSPNPVNSLPLTAENLELFGRSLNRSPSATSEESFYTALQEPPSPGSLSGRASSESLNSVDALNNNEVIVNRSPTIVSGESFYTASQGSPSVISETSSIASSEERPAIDLVRDQLKDMALENFDKLLQYEGNTRSHDTLTKGFGRVEHNLRKVVGMGPKHLESAMKREMEKEVGVKGRASLVEGLTVRHANIFNEFVKTYREETGEAPDTTLAKAREEAPEAIMAFETISKHLETPQMKFSKNDFAQIRALEYSQPKERSHKTTLTLDIASTATATIEHTRRKMRNNANINYNGAFHDIKITIKGSVSPDTIEKIKELASKKAPGLEDAEVTEILSSAAESASGAATGSAAATVSAYFELKDGGMSFGRVLVGGELKVGGKATIPTDTVTVEVGGTVAATHERPVKEFIGKDNLNYFKTQFDGLVSRKTIAETPRTGDGWEELTKKFDGHLDAMMTNMATPTSKVRKQVDELFATCQPHAQKEHLEKAEKARDEFFVACEKMAQGPQEGSSATADDLKKEALSAFRLFLYDFKEGIQKDYEKAVKKLS
ncbi:hypothetical protein HCH_05135 [Hahella chejuensis KCTC 2396]|uniref:Uncharacterized protein n=1 Tax=Hahella chejuensis (strain KCTC 2396) TaxID=349521 RepID=Q2SC09_HAHCH|nr:hypothetical protein [Hahella chejuensis]ABC31815.1 hypothetical protein HCH_05135 [Hahella chejuensis KCTC 2396]